jgi:hypothetical protein
MVSPPQPPDPVVVNWLDRHRGPVSFVLHMIGIPPTILGALLVPIYVSLVSIPIFVFAAVFFFGGYAIQFLGHALEGTDPGEITLLKRKLGWTGAARPQSSLTHR